MRVVQKVLEILNKYKLFFHSEKYKFEVYRVSRVGYFWKQSLDRHNQGFWSLWVTYFKVSEWCLSLPEFC